MVSGCQVRHMGPLEPAMCSREGRLVRAEHVRGRFGSIQIPPRTLWTSIPFWIQGSVPAMDTSELAARGTPGSVQEGGCSFHLRSREPPRRFRLLGFKAPSMELSKDRAAPGCRWDLGEVSERTRTAIRRDSSPG